jgi:hypothetical protein
MQVVEAVAAIQLIVIIVLEEPEARVVVVRAVVV